MYSDFLSGLSSVCSGSLGFLSLWLGIRRKQRDASIFGGEQKNNQVEKDLDVTTNPQWAKRRSGHSGRSIDISVLTPIYTCFSSTYHLDSESYYSFHMGRCVPT